MAFKRSRVARHLPGGRRSRPEAASGQRIRRIRPSAGENRRTGHGKRTVPGEDCPDGAELAFEELRLALLAFRKTYNRQWRSGRHGYRSPAGQGKAETGGRQGGL